jgi:aryl-alcohol dehydrogenase-like predicted oxidoreductase
VEKRKLGRTDLTVSELALGGLLLGRDFERGKSIVRRAVELGINYIDTAAGYSKSEESLGLALEEIQAPLIVSTKLGRRADPFQPQNRDALMRCVEESLKLLKRDRIDILMIHEPDRPGQYDWWTDPVNFDGPVMDLLGELKKQGVISFTGLGGTTAYEIVPIMRTGKFDVVLTAFNYSLLWREAVHAILPAAKELGMGVIVGSPLQQGALARRYDEEVRHGARWLSPPRRAQFVALYDFLDEIGMSLPEAGLRFVISNPDVSCVLMGAASPEEVEQNVAFVAKGPLPPDILKRLDGIAARVPFRPFEEPFGFPFGRGYRGPGVAGR